MQHVPLTSYVPCCITCHIPCHAPLKNIRYWPDCNHVPHHMAWRPHHVTDLAVQVLARRGSEAVHIDTATAFSLGIPRVHASRSRAVSVAPLAVSSSIQNVHALSFMKGGNRWVYDGARVPMRHPCMHPSRRGLPPSLTASRPRANVDADPAPPIRGPADSDGRTGLFRGRLPGLLTPRVECRY